MIPPVVMSHVVVEVVGVVVIILVFVCSSSDFGSNKQQPYVSASKQH